MYFVFKDESGRQSGYLMQGMGSVRFRAGGLGESSGVMIFFEDGTVFDTKLNGKNESAIDDQGKKLMGGVIYCEERILADTGYPVRRDYERRVVQTKSEKPLPNANQIDRNTQEQETVLITKTDRNTESISQTFPQRRWPPPPCLNEPKYEKGTWRDG